MLRLLIFLFVGVDAFARRKARCTYSIPDVGAMFSTRQRCIRPADPQCDDSCCVLHCSETCKCRAPGDNVRKLYPASKP